MMHHVPQTRLTAPAVAGQLERGVRRHFGALADGLSADADALKLG